MSQTNPNELTNDQRKDNLTKYDTLADGISGSATTLGGLNTLGLYAGTIKSETLLNAVIYTVSKKYNNVEHSLCSRCIFYPQASSIIEAG